LSNVIVSPKLAISSSTFTAGAAAALGAGAVDVAGGATAVTVAFVCWVLLSGLLQALAPRTHRNDKMIRRMIGSLSLIDEARSFS
jgi:hypothetical protein